MWPTWKSTYPLVAWYLYLYYDDERILATHYEGIAKLVEFLGTQADNYIITKVPLRLLTRDHSTLISIPDTKIQPLITELEIYNLKTL